MDEFEQTRNRLTQTPPKERPAAKDRLIRRARSDRRLTRTDHAVLEYLMSEFFWKDGVVKECSYRTLANVTNSGLTSVKRAIGSLEEKGYVLVRRVRTGPKSHAVNVYTLPCLLATSVRERTTDGSADETVDYP